MVSPRFIALPILLVAALLGFSAAPLSRAAQEPVTLRVWDQFTGPEGEAVDAVYAAFMAQNPDLTIVREVVTAQQMRQTVNTALASGTGPDVI